MTINAGILQYAAANKKPFARKDLSAYFREQMPAVLPLSVSQQLNRLLQKKVIIRVERGVYQLQSAKTLFVPQITTELRELNAKLKKHFPFAGFCLWHNNEITPFMHHIPNLQQIFVEVERDATSAVFDFLNENSEKRVFLSPDSNDYSRYIAGKEAIIIRALVSEAPVQTVENITIPTIEKILVDVIGDVDFEFMQGAEMHRFYQNVLERCVINQKKLLRYASRRNRKKEVEQLLNEAL
jgi:predicted transcriptional regulator of viral defense system